MLISNLIIGTNGATTLEGSSYGLSFPADKEQMLKIRGIAGAILVGGTTYRSEPYQSLDKPVLVSSTKVTELSNPRFGEILNLSPLDLADYALERFPSPVLVEGGRDFLLPLLKARKISRMYLTVSETSGDDRFVEYSQLTSGMHLKERNKVTEGAFEVWELSN
jgi:hypothetical protein